MPADAAGTRPRGRRTRRAVHRLHRVGRALQEPTPVFQGGRSWCSCCAPRWSLSAPRSRPMSKRIRRRGAQEPAVHAGAFPRAPRRLRAHGGVNMSNQFHWGQDTALRQWIRTAGSMPSAACWRRGQGRCREAGPPRAPQTQAQARAANMPRLLRQRPPLRLSLRRRADGRRVQIDVSMRCRRRAGVRRGGCSRRGRSRAVNTIDCSVAPAQVGRRSLMGRTAMIVHGYCCRSPGGPNVHGRQRRRFGLGPRFQAASGCNARETDFNWTVLAAARGSIKLTNSPAATFRLEPDVPAGCRRSACRRVPRDDRPVHATSESTWPS